jgi:hypothetical protein
MSGETMSASDAGYMINAKGHQVPLNLVKPSDRQIDETVREIHGYANDLMNQIARFRSHTYDDLGALMELLADQYGVQMRGMKEGGRGNVSFKSYDRLIKVEISVQDYVEYGPELQIAKKLVDQYIHEVSEGVPDEVKALLNHAFEVDKLGKVNREALYTLRRLDIDHPTWKRAMEAVKDSQRVESTREFVRISTRPNTQVGFKSMQINLANAEETEAEAS